jgi:hypothetical protein
MATTHVFSSFRMVFGVQRHVVAVVVFPRCFTTTLLVVRAAREREGLEATALCWVFFLLFASSL